MTTSRALWILATLGCLIVGTHGFRCYECNHVYSERGGLVTGDKGCSDPGWNLTEANTDFIFSDECIACTKTQTWLGADRYEIFRNCVIWRRGYDPSREQKNNTCATTQLKAGDYIRCVCTEDLCNADTLCEDKHPCIDPPAGNCPDCPDDTCPTSPSEGTVVGLDVMVVMVTGIALLLRG